MHLQQFVLRRSLYPGYDGIAISVYYLYSNHTSTFKNQDIIFWSSIMSVMIQALAARAGGTAAQTRIRQQFKIN